MKRMTMTRTLALFLAVPLLTASLVAVPSWAKAATATAQAAAPGQSLQPDGMGLRLSLPAGWEMTQRDGHTVVVSGAPGSPAYFATVTVTNQENPTPQDPASGAATLLSTYLDAIRARGPNQEVLREAPFRYLNPGPGADGLQAVVSFAAPSGVMRQWVVVVPRADIPVAHVIIYSATDEDFDTYLNQARRVLDSLRVLPAQR